MRLPWPCECQRDVDDGLFLKFLDDQHDHVKDHDGIQECRDENVFPKAEWHQKRRVLWLDDAVPTDKTDGLIPLQNG